jgi:uncharacterized membrane protein YuzA (DUF378 family)
MDYSMITKKLYMISLVLIIVGSLNWFIIGLTGVNFLDNLGFFSKIIYIIVGLSAFMIMFNRDTYLPFLGESVVPCSILSNRTPPGADTEVVITGPAGKKVLFWAAEPNSEQLKELHDWRKAYSDFQNIGVATFGANGTAILSVRKPQQYQVPWKGALKAHIHYRICGENGMLGRVETVDIPLKVAIEAFSNNVMLEKTSTFHPAPAIPDGYENYKKKDEHEIAKLAAKEAMSNLPMMAADITKLVQQMSAMNTL